MVKAAQLDPTQVGCDFCPIQATWPELRHPRMRMSGNRTDPRVLILGEAPGENEDARGAIFIGKSGTELRAHLPAKYLDEIGFQNTVRCRPTQDGKNRPPTAAEIHCCGALLEEDIESRPSITAILGCGGVPLRRFAPELTILKAHGIQFPVEVAGRALWFFPTFHPSFVLRMEAERTGRVRPVFEQDLKRFWREHTRWGTPSIARLSPDDVIIPRTREEAMALLARMQDPIAVDIETADADGPTLQPFSVGAYILSAAFSDGQTTIAFSVEHEEWDNPWGYDVLLNTVAARRWIAHNAGFELAWFRFNVPGERFGRFDDTMAMSRIFHRRSLLPLDAVSRIHLGVNIKALMPVNAKKILDYSLEAVLRYNGLDAQASALIYRKLQHVTRDPNYQELLRSVDSTTGMELMGLPVNIDTAKTAKAYWTNQAETIAAGIHQLTEVEAFARDRGEDFMITSPKQLGEVLDRYYDLELPRTEKGNLTTRKAVLAEIAQDGNPLAQATLDHREAVKLVNTYLDAVLQVPDLYPDGMLHSGYTVMFTATGRLSGEKTSIQNWPKRRNASIRNVIEVPRGYLLVGFDYGQLEARVLAMASRDKVLCSSIISGADIHTEWRDRLLQLYPDYVAHVMDRHHLPDTIDDKSLMKAARDCVKNEFVFASCYGSGAASCSQNMGVPLALMEELAAQFWTVFKGVRAWLKARREEYQRTALIHTLTGRERYQSLQRGNEMINGPIQGSAADIVAAAMNDMVDLSWRENDPHLHPRLQIHDDLTFILPDSAELPNYVERISEVLLKVRWPWQIVPLSIEAKAGQTWGAMDEFAVLRGAYNETG